MFTRELDELDPKVEGFLAERPERNLAASLLARAHAGDFSGAELMLAWDIGRDGAVAWFALRIPPWPLLITELNPTEAEDLVEVWLEHDRGLTGVSGVPAAAGALERAWSTRTGGRSRCRMRDAMHLLEEVIDPSRPPTGALRLAGEEDRGLLVDWEQAFVREAGVMPEAAAKAEQTVARRLASRSQYLWQDVAPVSTLAVSPEIAGIVRIGPVYTRPEFRARGYASAAVAGACHIALASGARRCMLFTDLANPTSNKIYAALGFRRFADWVELEFGG